MAQHVSTPREPAAFAATSSNSTHLVERSSASVSHLPFALSEALLLAWFVALATIVKFNPGPLPADIGLERADQQLFLPHRGLTSVLETVSTVAWPIPSAITLAVVIVLFLLLRRWLDAIVVVGCALITDEATYLVSQYIHRPRPAGHSLHILAAITNTYSFPSGHVVHVVAVFGLLIFLSTQVRRSLPPSVLWLVRVALMTFILAMGPSRLLEGEHWPSDVLAGIVWGIFWLVLSAHIYIWARHRYPRLLAADER